MEITISDDTIQKAHGERILHAVPSHIAHCFGLGPVDRPRREVNSRQRSGDALPSHTCKYKARAVATVVLGAGGCCFL